MKIAFFSTKEYDKQSFDPLLEKFGFEVEYFDEQLNSDTVDLAKDAIATCSFVNDDVNSDVLDKLDSFGVKAILLRCAGFDSVDLEKAKELGMPVLRVPEYSPVSVAEFAVSLLMSINRMIPTGRSRGEGFNFELDGLQGRVLQGKTAGVIGTGKIGKESIRILEGIGMNVIAYDLYPDTKADINYKTLDEVLSESNVITLHTPLTNETRHMINKESIAKMKDDVFLINSARGGLINTKDLIEALENGKFRGVGMDVVENEDKFFFADHSASDERDEDIEKLYTFDNVILTGHQAFFTDEALESIANTTLNNLKNYLDSEDITNEVNAFLERIGA